MFSVHFDGTGSDAAAIKIKLYVGMIGQQGHGHGAIRVFFADHQGRQPHAEGVIMTARVPDAHFFGLPRFDGADGDGFGGDASDDAAARSAGVLH